MDIPILRTLASALRRAEATTRSDNTSRNPERRLDSCEGRLDYYRSSDFSVCLLPRMGKLYRLQPPDRLLTVHIGPPLRRKSIRCILRRKGTWGFVPTGCRGRSPSCMVKRGTPTPQAMGSTELSGRRASWRCERRSPAVPGKWTWTSAAASRPTARYAHARKVILVVMTLFGKRAANKHRARRAARSASFPRRTPAGRDERPWRCKVGSRPRDHRLMVDTIS